MICSWKDQIKRLSELIKSLSDYYGDDKENDLKEYIRNVMETNKDDLGKAILYFEYACLGLKIKPYQSPEKRVKLNSCEKCGYVSPFCRCIEQGSST